MESNAEGFMVEKKKLTDAQFLDGLRTNDNTILKALYKKFFAIVLKYVVNNNGTEDEAKDVYQECIIVLYENVR